MTLQASPTASLSSDRGWLLNRGANVTIICDVSSVTKPTIILKKDKIIYPTEQVAEVTDPASGGTNLWRSATLIFPFEDDDAAKYICETKFGNDSVISRTLHLNIQGI